MLDCRVGRLIRGCAARGCHHRIELGIAFWSGEGEKLGSTSEHKVLRGRYFWGRKLA